MLWYDSDEVKDFHPHVEEVLWSAIDALGLRDELQVVHHPSIVGATTTPDFGIIIKSRSKYIFILEVKRTKADVESERFWIQTEGYVSALGSKWLTPGPKYFAITNLEETISFADRDQYVARNVLKNGGSRNGNFIKGDEVSLQEIKTKAAADLEKRIIKAYNQEPPEFAETWSLLVDSFIATYQDTPTSSSTTKKDALLYELLRVLFFYYLKSSYTLNHHANAVAFRALDHEAKDPHNFLRKTLSSYRRVLEIDFKQIFQNYPELGLFESDMTIELMQAFEKFIHDLDADIDRAYKENPAPEIFFKLLAKKIYERRELHAEGKIMSDTELARLLTELTISNENDQVIDPGSGDGALLDAAYDKLEAIYRVGGHPKSHNELLSQLHGVELDPFLNQLAAFRLLAKNLDAVDSSTEIDFINGDVFSKPCPAQFNVVLMNPPFLRNDDPENPIPVERKSGMITALRSVNGGKTLVEDAKQPNLYFYFMDWIGHYLKERGRAGVILMAKFLSNQDGEHLKRAIKDDVDAIISYPNNYFRGFRVTTCIVILEKGNTKPYVNFMNIRQESLLEDPSRIRAVLAGLPALTPEFSLVQISRGDLDPAKNWRVHFLDPAGDYQKIQAIKILKEIEGGLFAEVKRGAADNSGESKTIFLKPQSDFFSFFKEIEDKFIGPGLQNSKTQRNLILTKRDVRLERGIHFPHDYTSLESDEAFQKTGLGKLFLEAQARCGRGKWKKIVDTAYHSKVKPELLIPRAAREKHAIYVAIPDQEILLSTNFCYASGLLRSKFGNDKSLKAIATYLMSAFGQLQFELEGGNQEGMLKIETFMVKSMKSIDPNELDPGEIDDLCVALEKFDAIGESVKGDEGVETPRRDLDLVMASVLINHGLAGFENNTKLADFVELFLKDIVDDRSNQNG